jgi:hypothetical protein
MPEPLTYDDCLNGPQECSGDVDYRMPLSATGKPFPRCDHHWNKRLEQEEQHRTTYPDSPIAPDWFDPSIAGERWDEDY